MGNINTRHLLSLLIAVGGCIAGAYSAFAAFSNGTTIAQGTAGTMFGLAFAAVVVISWIMLPWADKRAQDGSVRDAWLWRGSWLLALGFVLANSIAYCAHYRIEMTEAKGQQIDSYERAQRDEAAATSQLTVLRTNPLWANTSACSRVWKSANGYCNQVRKVQSLVQVAQATLAQGRPGAKDPGAETLAWVLSADEAKVRRSLPIFWAVILELIASLCMREAFASLRHPGSAKRDFPMEFAAQSRMMAGYPNMRASEANVPDNMAFFGTHRMFSRQGAGQPQREAMNDNMPRLAYA